MAECGETRGMRERPAVPDLERAERDDAFARLNLIGESPAFLAVLHLIQRVAPYSAAVLIHGETGTGKELVARAIHYLSDRRGNPFIPINCGAIPDALFEAELFGHARGAFTDAREAREGLIAQARGGTLYLDELEAMSPRGQVALLRFLQDQEYRPVGGTLVRDANVRVVGSTNIEPAALTARSKYRKDLLFRLNVLTLALPPLRERGDDVVVLARAFVQRLSRRYSKPPKHLHADCIKYLRSHSWPGNVRELENLMHREFLLTDGTEIRLSATAATTDPAGNPDRQSNLTVTCFREAKARAIADFERAYVTELLARSRGNISLAARLAGKERSRLGKLVRKYGFSSGAFRSTQTDSNPS